ncbi:MAG TPA: flavin reductase family protein [Gemmatales bacterium]|nr:flavin reductase family protein [Gemmatales bacterium]HMP57802.1 flavin reductase family protein [Gemmatales bacterium]
MSASPDDAAWIKPLGAIPSGLFVLTLRLQERETGLLVSWVQQCGFDPPLVSLALGQGRYPARWLAAGAAATLNQLSDEDSALLKHFARGFGEDEPAFAGLTLRRRPDLAPVLEGALGYLDLAAQPPHVLGDHALFVCRVVDGGLLKPGKPWLHTRRSGLSY